MMQLPLSGEWQFRQMGTDEWRLAQAPGGVHTDLMAAGRIPDPFVADNEKRVQWVPEQNWEYRRSVTVTPELLAQDRVFLVCDGLDTLAEVRLNGRLLARTANMFHPHAWEIKSLLHEGENEFSVLFHSAVQYIAEKDKLRHLPDVGSPIPGGAYLRKAPSHFGWDWGPHLPAVGIWRDLRLETYNTARFADVYLRQRHHDGQVTLTAAVTAEVWEQTVLQTTLKVTAPDGSVQTAEAALAGEQSTLSLTIEHPQLWYPNGYGQQPLYDVEMTLTHQDTVLDQRTFKVGLRTIQLHQQPDDWGQSFTFVVNGIPIFAKGANWIPADSFPARISRTQLEHLIGSAAQAHHNMLRVWGGGYYEDEYFYDLCDRHGILVWQDFMFACAVYPLDNFAFLDLLAVEVRATVRRMHHRACLALWCGNNEMEQGWAEWGWSRPDTQDLKAAYERFFYHTLPEWIFAADPDHAYWPSSPSSNIPFDNPQSNLRGDIHQWRVWHGMKPFSDYRETPARFVSEFGFQSLPTLATIAAFAEPTQWNLTSYLMEYHQRHPSGNSNMVTFLTNHFRLPRDFPSLVYLTQLVQAEGMRIGVEHWRRHPACSGTLYWQLNDCWPVASWSSIDYFGRWKALHYASRRFYAPILLSIEDAGEQMGLFVTNDTPAPWSGEVRWSLETLAGACLKSIVEPVQAAPQSTTVVKHLDFSTRVSDENRRQVILVAELWEHGERLQMTIATFVPNKHLEITEPQIMIGIDGHQVTHDERTLVVELSSACLVRFVELSLQDADVVWSDNYFDLPSRRSVRVSCQVPEGWTHEQARQALCVRSLYDSF
ncbi:MAG: glycoside hydrolase family 2 protein [Anaerolineae bacterium]